MIDTDSLMAKFADLPTVEHKSYKVGILTSEKHETLIRNLDGIIKRTGITRDALTTSMRTNQISTLGDIKFVTNFMVDGANLNLLFTRGQATRMIHRMKAIGYYIESRVYDLGQVMDSVEDGGSSNLDIVSCLILPSVFTTPGGRSLSPYRVHLLYELLMHRVSCGLSTVMYVDSLDELSKLSPPLRSFVEEEFQYADSFFGG